MSDIDKESLISAKLSKCKKNLLLLLFGCTWLKGEIDLWIVCIKVEVKLRDWSKSIGGGGEGVGRSIWKCGW